MVQKSIKKHLSRVIKKHKNGALVIMRLPYKLYSEANHLSIKHLTDMGMDGVYVMLNRPFQSAFSSLTERDVDTERLFFIDAATNLARKNNKDERCIYLKPDIREITGSIASSLKKLKSEKKFIYLDSLTTLSLYNMDSRKVSRELIKLLDEKIFLILNVAHDLSERSIAKVIGSKANEDIFIK